MPSVKIWLALRKLSAPFFSGDKSTKPKNHSGSRKKAQGEYNEGNRSVKLAPAACGNNMHPAIVKILSELDVIFMSKLDNLKNLPLWYEMQEMRFWFMCEARDIAFFSFF